MKTMTIPPLRVSPELRQEAEAVLEPGETISGLVLDSLTRTIEYRKSRREFITRGLASAETARASGRYISAEKVVAKLERKLTKAKRGGK
jgi:predicted transcriptional regulator